MISHWLDVNLNCITSVVKNIQEIYIKILCEFRMYVLLKGYYNCNLNELDT